MGSAFQNIYAEGYPDDELRAMTQEDSLEYPARLAEYRRHSDPRYYKGVEYADLIESLACRRAAEAFAANGYSADRIFVNVQAHSGGPANNAVCQALLTLGDTVMGLNLLHGGHLSHGSSVNRSGKWYKAVHYTVDEDEKLDYEKIRALAASILRCLVPVACLALSGCFQLSAAVFLNRGYTDDDIVREDALIGRWAR